MRIILSSFLLPLLLAAALTSGVLVACSGAADDRPPPPATPAPPATPDADSHSHARSGDRRDTPIATPVPTATPTSAATSVEAATPSPSAVPSPDCRPCTDSYSVAHRHTHGNSQPLTSADIRSGTHCHRLARRRRPLRRPAHQPLPPRQPHPAPPRRQCGLRLVSREDLGIREVDTAEALAAAGLRYVRCAAGEVVPQEVGLYLLDVQTGAVEGWVLVSAEAAEAEGAMDGFISAEVSLSPGNRFLSFDRFQHDRVTGRTLEWDTPPLRRWGSLDDRRLLFRLPDEGGDLFVITDGTLQPVAQFAIPDGQEGQLQWLNFEYRSLVVRGQERDGGLRPYLHFFDLGEGAVGTFEPTATQALPGDAKTWSEGLFRLSSLGSSIELAIAGPDSCHVMHYGWDGTTLLDVSVPVVPLYGRA